MTLAYWCSNCGTILETTNADPLNDEIERLRIGLRDARDVIGQLRGALAEAAAEMAEWQHETDLAKAKIDSLQSQLVKAESWKLEFEAAQTDIAENVRLREQLECARRDAIEECARIADGWNMNMVAEDIATKIRALIDDLRKVE